MSMKIALGVHLHDIVTSHVYFNHIGAISQWAKRYDLMLMGTERTKVASARNHIADEAVKSNCSHILWLDGDHLVADDMLDLLVENADAAEVSGLVCKRFFPFDTVAFKCLPDGSLNQIVLTDRGKVVEVDACAMGCTLMNVGCLKELKKPWFYDDHFRSDLNVCMNFRKAGFRILVDTRVEIGHLGDPPVIRPSTAEALRARCLTEHMEHVNESSD